jgi:magnesium-transporting ATPase (P-type)
MSVEYATRNITIKINITKYHTIVFVATFIIASIFLGLFRRNYLHLKPLPLIQNIALFLIYMIVFVVLFCIIRTISFIISPDQYKMIEDQVDKIPARAAAATVPVRKKRPRKK